MKSSAQHAHLGLKGTITLLGVVCLLVLLPLAFAPSAHAAAHNDVVAFNGSAPAAPAKPQVAEGAAVSCFGQAFSIGSRTVPANTSVTIPDRGTNKTSSHCRDINIKFTHLTAPIKAHVCFRGLEGQFNNCNSFKTISRANQWHVIATNVRDGVEYRLELRTTFATKMAGSIAD